MGATLGFFVDKLTTMLGRGHKKPQPIQRAYKRLEAYDEEESIEERATRYAFTEALRRADYHGVRA